MNLNLNMASPILSKPVYLIFAIEDMLDDLTKPDFIREDEDLILLKWLIINE